MLCRNVIGTLLVACIIILRVQKVSSGAVRSKYSLDDVIMKEFDDDFKMDDMFPKDTENSNVYGSRTVQIGNVYSGIPDGKQLFGAKVEHTGNIYSGNPKGSHTYGPTLIQKNNVYEGNGMDGKIFGLEVTQSNNIYPKTSGKGETYGPVVIQDGNVYSFTNVSGNHTFSAVIKRVNNIYTNELDGKEKALKPTIIQKGNIFLNSPGINNTDTVVNRSDNRFHPTKDHRAAGDTSDDELIKSLGIMKKYHEGLTIIISHHVRNGKPSSKPCANGMMNSKRLDQIASLEKEVETEMVLLEALIQVYRNRKIICDIVLSQCAKRDNVKKWISRTKKVLAQKIAKSEATWMSLRNC